MFQRQVFSALSQISKHSVDLAEMVVEAEIFPAVLTCLRDPDEYVRKNVATLVREITKHTPEVGMIHNTVYSIIPCGVHFFGFNFLNALFLHTFLNLSLLCFQLSQLIVNAGGIAAIVDYVGESKGNVRLPGVMTLGYISAHSENLAMAVIVSKGCDF